MNKHQDFFAYWGALISFFSGLTLNDWAAVFGIIFGFATFLMNLYYKRKEYKLKEKYEKENHN